MYRRYACGFEPFGHAQIEIGRINAIWAVMGALLVETPSGVRFQLGTGFTDAERREPPPVGAQVTFVYRELTRDGVPRFASYWRRREAF